MQAFEDIIHNVASSKVLLGHSFLLSGLETDALNYLDSACPVLINLASSWRSIDSDVRFFSFTYLFVIILNCC